jgi:hypothetical protein
MDNEAGGRSEGQFDEMGIGEMGRWQNGKWRNGKMEIFNGEMGNGEVGRGEMRMNHFDTCHSNCKNIGLTKIGFRIFRANAALIWLILISKG